MKNESYYKYWGKASREDNSYHLLPYHCLDVAAVISEWWERSNTIRHMFIKVTNLDEEKTRAWLLFFVALHDYGKFDIRFQLKAPDAWKSCNSTVDTMSILLSDLSIHKYDHGHAGLYWFYQDNHDVFDTGTDNFLQEASNEWCAWYSWLAPVTGHHGVIPDDYKKDSNEYGISTRQISKELLSAIKTDRAAWRTTLENLFLCPAGINTKSPPPNIGNLSVMLAGLCSIADWIGSNTQEGGFSYDENPAENLKNWFENRKPIARAMLEEAGVISSVKPCDGISALLEGYKPRQVQILVDQLPIKNGLTIIEASTGSGKTEAALAYAWMLLANNLADSIIFALPTQATANAMLDRLEKASGIMFKNQTNVVLAHGRSRYQQKFIDLKNASKPKTVQNAEEAWVQCAQWLAQSRKRIFLGQVGVCTVDQVLVSVLPLRHRFVRGFGIGRSVLIVDEVHAYDAYMYGLLEEVLHQQKIAGGSAILLSATLPHKQKQKLVRAWGREMEEKSNAYPLITWCDDKHERFFNLQEMPEQLPKPFSVLLDLQKKTDMVPDEGLLDSILVAVAEGAQVCLVCNLVDVAQNTFERMLEKATLCNLNEDQILLFHSRFVFSDRQNKEKLVKEYFGRKSARSIGRVLVATQVVEQSLDLDFDWLITQLCPVDLLFQRMGRLHRHDRIRPQSFQEPRCTVVLPTEDGYGFHGLIYGDSRVLWRTQQYLENADKEILFPVAYREWIEPVYDEEEWGSEPDWVKTAHLKFEDEQFVSRTKARQLVNSSMNVLADTDSYVSALTRDGEMNLTVVPFYVDEKGRKYFLDSRLLEALDESETPEAINLNSLGVPASWGRKKGRLPEMDAAGMIWLPMQKLDNGEFSANCGDCLYIYRHDRGLHRIIQGENE